MKGSWKPKAKRLYRKRPRPVWIVRGWRWERGRRRKSYDLGGYRTPVQVCPRGCGFKELARRDLLAKTRLGGRAALHAACTFETSNCPDCGSRLVRRCARCRKDILAPVVDHCRFCGLPQPWTTAREEGVERADLRNWRPSEKGKKKSAEQANDPAKLLYRSPGRGALWVVDGNIAQLNVEAVVSNDDVDGRMWTQVARALKAAAGEGVERLAQEGRPFKLGQAWVTSPGGLRHMKGIVHVASTNRQGKSTPEAVRRSLVSALELATREKYNSLGVAAIGSGPWEVELVDWYRMFAEVAIEHFSVRGKEHSGAPHLDVVLVLFEPPRYPAEVKSARKMVRSAWKQAGKPADGTPWRPGLIARLARRLLAWRLRGRVDAADSD
ncbi:MAG TPA: macro domain-containing protein [Solirubrobacterales bacterium]|nr:macro domain-containing protein [Solirubrobacterales bacterium]